MPQIREPRHGTMQYWPRKRVRSQVPRIRHYAGLTAQKIPLFAGYKVGMTHAIILDTTPNSMTKGQEISVPITIVECPPLCVIGYSLYDKNSYGLICVDHVFSDKLPKETLKIFPMSKKAKPRTQKNFVQVRAIAITQPHLTGIGKKKPEIFEIALGGTPQEALVYAQSLIGKNIPVQEIAKAGSFFDIHAITKGKGYQGPVKRFGVHIRSHKSEKTKRGPGNVGSWTGNRSWPVSHAGQMGFHQRIEYNKYLIKIETDPAKVNQKGGFVHYGIIKNPALLVKGSLPGPAKRLVMFTNASRPTPPAPKEAPTVTYLSMRSKQ